MSVAEKLTTIAENEQRVYDAGKKAQYNELWDAIQMNGNRVNYDRAFSSWTENVFRPKYDMKPTSALSMFERLNKDIKKIDMAEHLKKYNILLDFGSCANFKNFLLYSFVSRLGTVDTRSANDFSCYVAYMLETIDLLILKDDGTQTANFEMASSLKNITIQGVIGKSWNMKDCPLSKDSIMSVINALSATTSKLTITFKKTAINDAFGIDIDDESTYPEGSEFYVLRNTKPNWTFSYV